MIGSGQGYAQIARRLSLSHKTVRTNASSVFSKLQAADPSEATVRARRAGLGADDGGWA